jgi:hypothetical protein
MLLRLGLHRLQLSHNRTWVTFIEGKKRENPLKFVIILSKFYLKPSTLVV